MVSLHVLMKINCNHIKNIQVLIFFPKQALATWVNGVLVLQLQEKWLV